MKLYIIKDKLTGKKSSEPMHAENEAVFQRMLTGLPEKSVIKTNPEDFEYSEIGEYDETKEEPLQLKIPEWIGIDKILRKGE